MQDTDDRRRAFGVWLRQRRQRTRLTQDQLAERAGCTASMLQKLERGLRRPSRDLVGRLADTLGVTAAERLALLALVGLVALDTAPSAAAPGTLNPPAAAADQRPAETPLLLTKLQPPPLRRNIVGRPRLIARLEQMEQGVTLVVAPAGSGKTTLVSAWMAVATLTTAWVSLDEHDSDPLLVLRYLVAAIQRASPLTGAAALQLLQTPQPSSEAVLTLLLNDISSLAERLVLVLDDYHRVQAPAVHQVLAYLVAHLPPALRLMIITREDPPLPLARLRARHQLHEIRAADLGFTTAEAAAFFGDSMGLALHDHEIAALQQRTEGWVAGMQLAALALRDQTDPGAFIATFSGQHRLVLDYLVEEVLAGLPAPIYSFLLQTSLLERLCGPLCDAVVLGGEGPGWPTEERPADASSSQLMLRQLEQANLFVVPLDDQRHWYRYHLLFGTMLQERLIRGTSPGAVAELHGRAADWLAAQGLVDQAIDHALAGGHWDSAAALIVQVGDALLQRGGVTRLQQMISALPAELRSARPQLLALHGRALRQVFDLGAARGLMAQAAAAFGRAGEPIGQGECLVTLADCCRMLGAYSESRRALAAALESPLPPARRAQALLSQLYEYAASDQWPLVIPTLVRAIDLLDEADDRQALHDVAINLTSLVAFLPGGALCIARLRQLIARAPVASLSLLHAADLFLLGLTQLLDGQIAAAHATFERQQHVHDQIGTISQASLELGLWHAHTAALLGAVPAAEQRMRQTVALLEQPALTLYRQQNKTFFTAVQCLLVWAQGRADAVRAHVAAADAWANDHEWPIIGRLRQILHARARLDACDWAAAEELLRAADTSQGQLREAAAFGDVGLLLAHSFFQQGRRADALRALEWALAYYQQHRMPGLLLLQGLPVIAPLLRLAVVHAVHPAFASRVLHLVPPQPGPLAQLLPAPASEPSALTAREREVLQLIAQGLSNAIIAERLVVSVVTVKKHIHNLFAKLDAQSRTQALVRARERGLV